MEPKTIEVHNWGQLVGVEEQFSSSDSEWVFRGQSSLSRQLRSTFERACDDFGVVSALRPEVEHAILADFRRSSHVYAPQAVPSDGDTLSWFALMRHYGAPCRFMDFTYSLFIATYFAAESEKADPVIWAINKSWLTHHLEIFFKSVRGGQQLRDEWYNRTSVAFKALFIDRCPEVNLVAALNPMRTNDRLLVQQGLFLCCTDARRLFQTVLEEMPKSNDNVINIHIASQDARKKILARLHRTAVNRAALFPGLQGFAESLRPKIITYLRLQELRDKGSRMGPPTIGV